VLRDTTSSDFNPDAAGDAELEYWVVHRRFDGEKGRPELIDALTRIAVIVYGLSAAEARPAGAARAHAADTWSTTSPSVVRRLQPKHGQLSRSSCAARTVSCMTLPRTTLS